MLFDALPRSLPLAFALGCAATPDAQVRVVPEMPSVLEVTWPRLGDGEAWVEFGEGFERVSREAQGSQGDEVRVLVVGAVPGQELTLRAVESSGRRELTGPSIDAQTELLIQAPPAPQIDTLEPEAQDGRLVLTSVLGVDNGPLLLDRDGNVLWYWPLDEGRMAIDSEVDLAGQGVWTLTQPRDYSGSLGGRVLLIGWDGEVLIDWDLPGAHHALAQLGDGRVVVTERVEELDEAGEVHINSQLLALSEDGTQEIISDLWSISPNYYNVTGGAGPHANGLTYNPENDSLLWSFLTLSAVVEVSVKTGERIWAVGNIDYALPWAVPSEAPSVLHAPSLGQGGELVLFDNGDANHGARVVAYSLDHQAPEAREAWSFEWSGGGEILTLGDAHELSDGHLLVSWGMRGQLEELDADDALIWRASSLAGAALGNVQRIDGALP